MLLYLLRHGSTNYNDLGLVQGQLDIPLNDKGKKQINSVAKHCKLIPFSRIYTSDLARATETAAIIAEYKPGQRRVIVAPALRDRDYGSLEGKEWDEAEGVPDDAESQESLTARLESWLSTLIETHTPTSTPPSSPTSPNGPKNNLDIALVVTHEECLLALLNILTHQPSPVQVSIAAGVDVGARVENATFAIVRVWWEKEDKEEGLVPRGRLEAWAVGGLLQD